MKTYVRPMAGWWRRNPFYLAYMARELSSVLVTAYALVLLVGLLRLAQGRDAYEAWRASLAGGPALLFHFVTLALMIVHAWSWFRVMPKTMPFIRIGGWRVPDRLIVVLAELSGVAAAVCLLVAARFGAS